MAASPGKTTVSIGGVTIGHVKKIGDLVVKTETYTASAQDIADILYFTDGKRDFEEQEISGLCDTEVVYAGATSLPAKVGTSADIILTHSTGATVTHSDAIIVKYVTGDMAENVVLGFTLTFQPTQMPVFVAGGE